MTETSAEKKAVTIAVVNDDPVQLQILEKLLKEAGFQCRPFISAESALVGMDRNDPPGAIITDLHMPGIDGWRFCRLLRSPEYSEFNGIPVIVASAIFSGQEPAQIAADLGAEAFIEAPFDGRSIIATVREVLAGRSVRMSPRVLIADSDPAVADALEMAFRLRNHHVERHDRLDDALRACASESIHMALLDQGLPQGGCERLLRILRELQPHCTVVITTPQSDHRQTLEWIKQGVAACEGRPFDPLELVELCLRARREQALLQVHRELGRRTSQLRESEEHYRMLVDNSSDVIWTFNLATMSYDYVSPAGERLYGMPLEDLRRMNMRDLHEPESRKKVNRAFTSLLEGDIPEGRLFMEAEHIIPGKGPLWMEISATVIRDEQGTAIGFSGVTRDISKRKETEQALNESERRFRRVLNVVPDMVSIHDRDMTILYSNWQGFAAVPEGERIEGSKCYAIYRGRDSICPDCRAVEALETGRPSREEVLLPEGRWVDLRVVPVLDDEGSVEMFMEWVRDITEEKRAEEALRESEARFRFLTEHMNDVVWTSDLDMRLTYISPSDERLLGFPRDERMGHDVAAMLTPLSREKAMKVLAEELAREDEGIADPYRSVTLDLEYVHRDGSTRWLETIASGIRGEEGRLVGFHGVSRDITEHKKAEEHRKRAMEALRESEERFRRIFESTPDAVSINTLDDGVYVDVNEGFVQATGFSREEVLGKSSVEMGIWHDREDRKRLVDMLRERGHCDHLESHFIWKDGEVKSGSMSARLITMGGVPHVISVTRNTTELKRAEEERRNLEARFQHAQKLESVGRLAGGMAHDFNNMLGVIFGHADMALEELEEDHPVHHDIREIRRAAERSSALTRQLLAFARRQIIVPGVLDINETVSGAVGMMKRLIGETIDLSLEGDPDLWPVLADRSQVEQVLANLCVNARDAIDEKTVIVTERSRQAYAGQGAVRIKTANRVVGPGDIPASSFDALPGEYVSLSLEDDGCGMDSETISKLYEPFFTTKAPGTGTGLGLATVYGIVTQNGGFIDIESEPGRGSTFTIFFPRHRGDEVREADRVIDSTADLGGSETILLVEDERSVLNVTERMLTRLGYTVLATDCPERALELASANRGRIDLLLTDVVMPVMNGRDLARFVLARDTGVSCLYMSGYTADVMARQGVLDQGMYFIQKPFSPADIALKIREVLDGNRATGSK